MTDKKMSAWDKVNLVRAFNIKINYTQKFLLLIIATHLGNNDFCFLSLDTFMDETCIKKRTTISDHLKILEKIGLITIYPPSEGYKSNRYSINFDLLIAASSNPQLLVDSRLPVTHGYRHSNPQLLDQSPTVTGAVTHGYPNRNIKEKEKKDKNSKNLFLPENQEPKDKRIAKKYIWISKEQIKHPDMTAEELANKYDEQFLTIN